MIVQLGHLRRYDWILLATSVLLVVFGLMALYSTSLGGGGVEADFSSFHRQLLFAATGIVIALVLPVFNYRSLPGLSRALYVAGLVLLVAVLLFGASVRGSRSWFDIMGFGVQPVEVVKIILIITFARFFADHARQSEGIVRIAGSAALLAAPVVLVLLQPDLGSALLLVMPWGAMLLLSGVKRSHLITMALTAITVVAIAWMFVLQPYQRGRILTFLDPDADPLGTGYNVTQSVIAIGSGQVAGRGLGFGSQSQLRFLPERQTDFIFAVIAEELGFFGVLLLMTLFATLFYRCYVLARSAQDDFTLFLCAGIAFSIALEAFTNLGGNLRMLPVTGVTLPFVSYGGSSMLSKFAMIGLLQSVAVRR